MACLSDKYQAIHSEARVSGYDQQLLTKSQFAYFYFSLHNRDWTPKP